MEEIAIHALLIGGTRNLGLSIAERLLQRGHSVTVFNRGMTPGDLPHEVERLRGDRGNPKDMQTALRNRTFDAVVDTTLYTGADTGPTIDALKDKTSHYIFISTGQVYFIRRGVERPFREEDYEGEIMAAPRRKQFRLQEWALWQGQARRGGSAFLSFEAERLPLNLTAPSDGHN